MSTAHKGSRLMLSGNSLPVDFTSAHFDYNNDETGTRFGDLIEADPTSVFTMRPSEGKFGGAIAVDQGTTNVWSGALQIYNNYSTGGNMTASMITLTDTYMGQPIYRLTMTPVSANAVTNVQGTNQGGQGVMGVTNYTYQSGNTYLASIYWRPVNRSDISVGGQPSNMSGWLDYSVTYSGNDGWNRNFAKVTLTGNATDYKFWGFKSPSAVANEPIIIDWTCPQIEQKAYPTSYTSGTRASGLLKYNREIINTEQGCMSFWLYARTDGNSSGTPNPIFSAGVDGCFDLLIDKPTGLGFLRFYNKAGGSTQLRTNIKYDTWSHVVVYWKRNLEVGIYIDGVLDTNNVTPVDWALQYWDSATGLYIGSGIRSNPNILVSDLRIDAKMPTAEDVSAWYISQRPFHNPFDKRAYAL